MSVTEAPGFYTNVAAIWLLCGLLGAGFYVAFAKDIKKHLGRTVSRRRHRQLAILMLIMGIIFGPLGIAAALFEMARKKTWYGWALW